MNIKPEPLVTKEQQVLALNNQLKQHKKAYLENPMPSAQLRVERLKSLKKALLAHRKKLTCALSNDFGQRAQVESELVDLLPLINYTDYSCKKIKAWMKSEKRHGGLLLTPSKIEVMYQPVGVVGILGSWNAPIAVTFGPLITALSAGNSAMIKMSEFNPETNAVVKSIIEQAFEPEVVSVFDGEADISAEFSKLPFDHMVFTGSTMVGRHVMSAAAKNLTPVTLELGGKCPVIIDSEFDIEDAVDRIILGKSFNGGQICLSPDYVFCLQGKEQEFIATYQRKFAKMYPDFANNKDFTSIHSNRYFERIQTLIADAKTKGASIHPAAECPPNPTTRVMPTCLISNVTDEMTVMQEEIFGPILLIKSYQEINQAIDYINANPRPLGLYLMSHNKKLQQHVVNHTHSGGVSINDVIAHAACDDAPFGGIGESGIGHYHGPEGFKAMSKAKTVLTRGKFYPSKFIKPPYKDNIINRALDFWLKA